MAETSVIDVGEWAEFETRVVRTEHGALSVRVGGAGSELPVLFGHSILTSSAIWHRQAKLLVAEGHRVVCIDMRGHGASTCDPGPYVMDELVADTVAVLDALSIERVHQVGVSLGGMLAIGMGLHHSDRLASLVICAARADAPAPFVAAWQDRIALARNSGLRVLICQTADRWFGAEYLAVTATLQWHWRSAWAKPRSRGSLDARRPSRASTISKASRVSTSRRLWSLAPGTSHCFSPCGSWSRLCRKPN